MIPNTAISIIQRWSAVVSFRLRFRQRARAQHWRRNSGGNSNHNTVRNTRVGWNNLERDGGSFLPGTSIQKSATASFMSSRANDLLRRHWLVRENLHERQSVLSGRRSRRSAAATAESVEGPETPRRGPP